MHQLYIGGAYVPAASGATYESIDPATAQPWATFAAADQADVDAAVAAARAAHESGVWRNLPAAERGAILSRVGDLLVERQDEIVMAEVQDAGGTFRKGNIADIPASMQTFQYFGELIANAELSRTEEEFVPVMSRNVVKHEPIGVVAAIVPWNFPLAAASWKIAPALAAGCTMVLKPSPYTPASALLLAEICTAAGVPAGVLNVVTGPSAELGAALVAHPGVDKVAFTGSTRVGKLVMSNAAETVKSCTLELGGKSANIILPDANLDIAAMGAAWGTFFHSGQVCQSGTRVLVHEDQRDEFVEKLVAVAARISVGDPMDPMNTMGPLISQQQLDTVERYVGIGREEGARTVCGGKRPEGLGDGYFYEPTVFVDVTNDMVIAREEIFGPVVCVMTYASEEEAIAIANDSKYGLAAAVWSSDVENAEVVADKLEAGTVWINDYHLLNPKYPFGGYKQSGNGRELGPEGLRAYQVTKHIHVGQPAEDPMEKHYFMILVDL
jgi:aldehyde dehydrogenase (NAD+)